MQLWILSQIALLNDGRFEGSLDRDNRNKVQGVTSQVIEGLLIYTKLLKGGRFLPSSSELLNDLLQWRRLTSRHTTANLSGLRQKSLLQNIGRIKKLPTEQE